MYYIAVRYMCQEAVTVCGPPVHQRKGTWYFYAGGILETDDPEFQKKKQELNRSCKAYRVNHISWWAQELANGEEMEQGRKNLRDNDNTVDFIITHCCSTSTQVFVGGSMFRPDRETDYLEYIKNHTNYKKWFFGHYHSNRNVSDKEILIYEQIIRVS